MILTAGVEGSAEDLDALESALDDMDARLFPRMVTQESLGVQESGSMASLGGQTNV